MEDLSDSTLVLVGHGSTLNADSAAPVWQLAKSLRVRGIFARVLECFWKEHPLISGVLRGAAGCRVFVVPVFISDGYFTEEVIPRELGIGAGGGVRPNRPHSMGGRSIHYCRPVGTHPRMSEVILARAREAVTAAPGDARQAPPPKDISLFLAAHGTRRHERSRDSAERLASVIAAMGSYPTVQAVFMEEEPLISRCFELARTRDLVVVPFFISDGLHSREDIPVLLGEDPADVQARLEGGRPTFINPTVRAGHRVWYADSVGGEPLLADVVLERVREVLV